MSLGGWSLDPEYSGAPVFPQPNDSEIVSFDPTNETFCTYQIPGVDVEVVGMTAQGDRIFFLESHVGGHPPFEFGVPYVADPGDERLACFKPSDVGVAVRETRANTFRLGT